MARNVKVTGLVADNSAKIALPPSRKPSESSCITEIIAHSVNYFCAIISEVLCDDLSDNLSDNLR